MSIKLEVGKTYTLRGGASAECLAVWDRKINSYQAIMAAEYGTDKEPMLVCYTLDGRIFLDKETGLDVVKEKD